MGNSKRRRRDLSSDSSSVNSSDSDYKHRRSRHSKKRSYDKKHSSSHRQHSKRSRKRRRSIGPSRESTKTPPLDLLTPLRAATNQTTPDIENNSSLLNNTPSNVNNPIGNSASLPTSNFWAQNNFPVAFSVVPEFDPSDNSQTIENWINKVSECAQIYCWNDRQICHYALPKLSGLSKKWYQGLPSVLFNWNEWVQKLKQAFPSNENYGDLLTSMLRLICKFSQSLEHYYYYKMALINKCDTTGNKAVGCLIHGIDDKFVRMGLGACMFSEPEQVLNYLRTVSQHDNNTSSSNFRNRNNASLKNSNKVSTELPRASTNDNIRCYNCNELGHISLKCNKPIKRCNFCFKLGHDTKDCRRRNANNSDDLVKTNTGIDQNKAILCISNDETANSKYYKNIRINNVNLQGYVDLGSKCTLIRKSHATLIVRDWDIEKLPILQGFGNSAVKPLGKFIAIVEIGSVKAETEVLVVDDNYLQTPVLVGQSFTEKPNVIILKTTDELVFMHTPDFDDNVLRTKVYADSNKVIKSKTVMPIDAVTNDTFSGGLWVQYSLRILPQNEYAVLSGIFQFETGKGYLMLANLSSNDLNIKKGSLLVRGQQYQEVNKEYIGLTTETKNYEELPLSDIKISTEVTEQQKVQLFDLLKKYRDCFAMNLGELGKTNLAKMDITLTDNRPVVYNPYRISHSERSHLNKMIEELLLNGIIRESASDYSSPVILVSKKNGDKRLCIDYRALNRKTLKDKYPLPRIEDQLDRLGGNKFFISLDLTSGYYQVPMSEASKRFTAFVTPDGLYEFERMPFGLANAPSVFQRTINCMLRGKQNLALAYMDDLLVTSRSVEEGLDKLEKVFQLLRSAHLTLNLRKCDFFQTRINYLGYEVSSFGIRPGSAKIQAVLSFPLPKNVHEVRQFVGLTSYFRRFIQNYSMIAKPLTILTKKNAPWCFDEPQIKAFNELKSKLTTRPVLALYDPGAELEIHTDASKIGIGAILLQRVNSDKVFHPISYYSRQTTPDESKLHSYELETLAVVCALNRFRVYVLGKSFKVVTDCAAIRCTMTKKDLIPRVARWYILMQEYDFTVEHRDGNKMSHVDALSRNPSDSKSHDVVKVVDVLAIDDDAWLRTVQEQDSEIQRIINILNDSETKDIVEIHKNYTVKNGRLYRIRNDKNGVTDLKWVVPKSVRWQIVRMNHDDVGHFGFDKTYNRINQIYWFKKMRRFIKKYCNSCLNCAHNKLPAGAKEGELHPIPKVNKPFDTLHTDHCGPFPISKKKNCHILVVIDSFTKFIYIKPVKDVKSSTSIRVFTEYFSLFGVPRRLISDRGTSFTSKEFSDFTNKKGVKHILNAVASPRANGQVERYNRTIVDAITAANHNKQENEWDLCIPQIQWSLNNTINKSTGRTSSEMLFGVQTTGVSDGFMNPLVAESHTPLDRDEIRSDADARIQISQQVQKERFDKSHKKPTEYKVGDLVRVEKDIRTDPGHSRKLLPKCVGPYRISKVIGNDRYEIEDTPITRKEGCKPYRSVYAVDKLHPWLVFNHDAMSSDSE